MTKHQVGFTLVELSIVLVILGLLVGGVLTGQTLIRAAELRSVITQYSGYMAATQTFRDKYFALPGDMPNATTYWGAQAAPGSCGTSSSTTALTCNGNGDGHIDFNSGSAEPFRFWQHLANAGLVEGHYDGVIDSGGAMGTNSPAGRISGTLWETFYDGTISGTNYKFDGDYGNLIEFGIQYIGDDPKNPAFKPEDAYNIDKKMDDGKPATGMVVINIVDGSGFDHCTDTASSSNMAANYNLTNTALACDPVWRKVY